MINNNQTVLTSTKLKDLILEAIQDKKGKKITILDLQNIEESSADFYIICQGTSTTQVGSIAQNVVDHSYLKAGERPIAKEGFQTGEWALIDFFNVVVHIFIEPVRVRYALEDLWGDAKIKTIKDLD